MVWLWFNLVCLLVQFGSVLVWIWASIAVVWAAVGWLWAVCWPVVFASHVVLVFFYKESRAIFGLEGAFWGFLDQISLMYSWNPCQLLINLAKDFEPWIVRMVWFWSLVSYEETFTSLRALRHISRLPVANMWQPCRLHALLFIFLNKYRIIGFIKYVLVPFQFFKAWMYFSVPKEWMKTFDFLKTFLSTFYTFVVPFHFLKTTHHFIVIKHIY